MADRACRDCRELISAFVDGEATREENLRLRQHLATCADCRATLDAYREIGASVRSLPAVHAPRSLTAAIFAQTINAEPRRLFLITSRLGYSLAAVASVLLIFVVAAYLIIGGYERGLDPVVDSSKPKTNQVWELQESIEITFNKDMNRESVVAALGMQPSGEKDRLAQRWEGNTLIIGGNTTLKPGVAYEIKISTDATDKWGKRLKEPFELTFSTQSSLSTVQTPTPQPTLTPTMAPADSTPTPAFTPTTTAGTPVPALETPVAPTATAGDSPAPGSGNGTEVVPVVPIIPVDPTATPITTRPTPTEPPIEPTGVLEPTSTLTPSPTATITPEPPTPTPTPIATATAIPTEPAPPTATATLEAIPVTGAIGDIYWSDQAVRDRLGEATAPESSFIINQLDFQLGVMLLDQNAENIYVLKAGSGWEMWPTPVGVPPLAEEVEPGSGIYTPGGVFGALWVANPPVRDGVGYALSQYAVTVTASAQQFAGGLMIATPSTVYVLYDSLTWDWFTHNSGS